MAKAETIITSLVIHGIEAASADVQSFIIQIRENGSTRLLVNEEVGATQSGMKSIANPFIFDQAIKGVTYQVRCGVKKSSSVNFTQWEKRTAGDVSFGSGHTWTNSVTSRSTCVDVSVKINLPPPDFDRIEVYVRDASGTAGHENWIPDYSKQEESFYYPWVGTRNVTKYFYAKAFDVSGNASGIVLIGSGNIQAILPGDMDTTPPDSSTVTATLEN